MKLELKYLAPYLPYQLKIIDKFNQIYTMTCSGVYGIRTFEKNILSLNPILRPLSDLHKYNQIGDNSFRDELLLKSELQNDFERDFITDYIDNLHFDKILYAPYSIIEKLLEWHFDIFNLIENGLAVDFNKP